VALGVVLFLSDWNWHAAERSFQRALALSPDHSEAYVLYGRLLEAVGRPQEGLEMKLKALQRDPHSPAVHLQIALAYWNQRRFHECIDWANRTLTLDPDHLLAREYLAGAYWAMGDFDRHMTENLRHAESFGMPPEPLERLRDAYRTGGRRGVIDYTLSQLSAADAAPALVQLALLHGEAGHLDDAFQYLNRAIDEFDPSLVHLAVAPQWDCLRSDPRFIGCLRRIGFEPTLA
jgi:tetratricopeptide (TPR) repeat protein